MRSTIFALSSGTPPAGVAIIRLSGPNVRFGFETMIGRVPNARTAVLAAIRDQSGSVVDRGLVLFFPGPHSFTGEDVAELQIHGGRATVSAVLTVLSQLGGFRLAEPGEFTKRAFENGRMDLTEVEGLSDLLRAETEAQRRQALDQADGSLRSLYQSWAYRLTHARAMIEAEFDFSDEEDIPGSVADKIWTDLSALSSEISDHVLNASFGEIVRDGYRIALIGPPNSGKSSLLNNLAKRDVAIVSDIPGTTRDIVEIRLDIGGILVLLQDTAGIRNSDDFVELEGIKRSLASAKKAHLVLQLADSKENMDLPGFKLNSDKDVLRVRTKIDLTDISGTSLEWADVAISNLENKGIEELLELIKMRISKYSASFPSGLPTRERHIVLLNECNKHLQDAIAQSCAPNEIRTENLRLAATALGKITGRVDVEDLLGVVFSEFCVGK